MLIQILLSRGFPLSHNSTAGTRSSANNYLVHGAHPCRKELRCHLLLSPDSVCLVRHRWHFRQPEMGLPVSDRPALPSGYVISFSSAPMHSDAPPAPSGSGTRNVSDNTNNIEHQAVTTFSKMINDEKSWASIAVINLKIKTSVEGKGNYYQHAIRSKRTQLLRRIKDGKSQADTRQLEIILKSSEFSCLSKKNKDPLEREKSFSTSFVCVRIWFRKMLNAD